MSSTTTFKCDRCSEESKDSIALDLRVIEISCAKRRHYGKDRDSQYEVYSAEWCAKCCREMKVIPLAGKHSVALTDEQEANPTPVIEDLVRAIVREEIANQPRLEE